ncbi:hypothetical protein N0V87_002878 [Didymella glomerata]|uniref:Uncharacterized protein n=1 Tax=Didymella glomerata TaxID=749621 RepID=A0A9W9C2B5_9PLEO|nr:hypothetical protein N0V87_002878 [Didymella glomerata]
MADKGEKPTEQPKGGDHIPTTNEEEEEEQAPQGLLSKIGDPVGNVLGTVLRPVGAPLEKGVTGPLGNTLGGATRPALGPLMGEKQERSELLGGDNKDSYESKPESIAGKEQTGDNPLGLDQTGRWGFADDEKK